MPHRIPLVALAAVVVLALLVPSAAQAAGPQAQAARQCSLAGDTRDLGPTYTTSLKVRRVSCGKGKSIVTAYYNCRVRNGGKDGRCSGVGRWDCSERRFNVIPTQYDANVTCKRGRKRVKHSYTQFT